MRGRMRSVFAKNPRSQSRSTTAEAGRRFLKNAKSLKQLRSPGCKSRSTHERGNVRADNRAPNATKLTCSKIHLKSKWELYVQRRAILIGVLLRDSNRSTGIF